MFGKKAPPALCQKNYFLFYYVSEMFKGMINVIMRHI